jgi:hypothetical protein
MGFSSGFTGPISQWILVLVSIAKWIRWLEKRVYNKLAVI